MESFAELADRPEGRLAVALAVGLVIGAERERRAVDTAGEPTPVVFQTEAGVRTFALVAFCGAVAALLGIPVLVGGLAFVGAAGLVAHLRSKPDDRGLTTEVALVLTFLLGALAERAPGLSLGAGLCTALLLALRAPLHRVVRSVLSGRELLDALVFGIAAVVILPLLPNRAIDPWGVLNPFVLWRLAVLIMGMSGLGYVAERALGARYGLALAGLGSGFVSSSATIAAMGARAAQEPALLRPAVAGAAASTVSTFVQLALIVGAAAPGLLGNMWPALAAGGLTAAVYAVLQVLRVRGGASDGPKGHAFQLGTAASFAALVSIVTLVSTVAQHRFGQTGAIVAAGLAGLADTHSAAAALAALVTGGQLPVDTAAFGVLVAVSANTLTKMTLATTSGPRAYAGRVLAGLILVLGAAWAALFLGTPRAESPVAHVVGDLLQ